MSSGRDQVLEQIVSVLKSEFNPSRMYLFGSRATGTHQVDSDYDFVLVVPGDRKNRLANRVRAREVVQRECGVRVDVWIYSQREFDEWKSDFSSIPETAISTGREIDLG